jgi:acyl-CoA thioesterase I
MRRRTRLSSAATFQDDRYKNPVDVPVGSAMKFWIRGILLATLLAPGAVPGQAAPLRIVAVGASNTSGWGVGRQNAFPARLQAILRRKGIDAKVINAGVFANTTLAMLHRLKKDVPAGTDIVILQPGTNDRRFRFTDEQRAANIAEIVRRLQRRGIHVIVFDPPIPWTWLQLDGVHFNMAAHARIAATLAEKVMHARENGCRKC